jgi:hypothetical protein
MNLDIPHCCPFCGASPRIVESSDIRGYSDAQIFCVCPPEPGVSFPTMEECIREWNKRSY